MKNLVVMSMLAAAVVSTGAVAQTAQQRQACENDAFQVCGQAIPDRSRVFRCMVRHVHELSPGCQQVMAPYAGSHRRSTVGAGNSEGDGTTAYHSSFRRD